MEILENIAAGVTIVLVSSLIAWLYHIRQLYATAPVLFQKASSHQDGAVFQLVICNRGNQVEENVEVELAPSISAEVVATNLPGVTLDGPVIRIERIHKKQEINLLLRVDGDTFDSSKILSVSSHDTHGRICKSLKDIPFNYGMTALVAVILTGIIPLAWYLWQVFGYVEKKVDEQNLEAVRDQGWNNLDGYRGSDLRKSYSDREFPVRFTGIGRKAAVDPASVPSGLQGDWQRMDDENGMFLNYEINNKTASPVGVMAFTKGIDGSVPYYADVAPLSKESMIIPVHSVPDSGNVKVEFLLKMDDEWLERIEHSVDSDRFIPKVKNRGKLPEAEKNEKKNTE